MKRTPLVIGVVWRAGGCGYRVVVGALSGGPVQIRVYGGGQVATPTAIPRTISLAAAAR